MIFVYLAVSKNCNHISFPMQIVIGKQKNDIEIKNICPFTKCSSKKLRTEQICAKFHHYELLEKLCKQNDFLQMYVKTSVTYDNCTIMLSWNQYYFTNWCPKQLQTWHNTVQLDRTSPYINHTHTRHLSQVRLLKHYLYINSAVFKIYNDIYVYITVYVLFNKRVYIAYSQ